MSDIKGPSRSRLTLTPYGDALTAEEDDTATRLHWSIGITNDSSSVGVNLLRPEAVALRDWLDASLRRNADGGEG